jgi:glucokinase
MYDYAVGVDLGGTKVATALVRRDGLVVNQVIEPTQKEKGFENVIDRMGASIRTMLECTDSPVVGVGVGAAGSTDSQRGVVVAASNLGWENVPLREMLCERIGDEWRERIWVDKDTNAAVLGEMMYGAGRGSDHIFYVTVGTGIGGGMILDGTIYHGASDGASDFGHLVLDPDGIICGCGKRGCVETLASGVAIARMAREALNDPDSPTFLSKLDPGLITAHDVAVAAQNGDQLAKDIITQAGYWLGRALAYYVDLNNPERIIIGGGVMGAGDLLLKPVHQTTNKFSLPNNAAAVQILPAGLGADSGVIGAAAFVWQHHKEPTQEYQEAT